MTISPKPPTTPAEAWENALVKAFTDYWWYDVLDELDTVLQRWKAGEVHPLEVKQALDNAHAKAERMSTTFYYGLAASNAFFVKLIFENREHNAAWLEPWLKENLPPTGYQIDKV